MHRSSPFIYGILMLMVTVVGCTPHVHLVDNEATSVPLEDKELNADAVMESVISPYRVELENEMDVVIGSSEMLMAKLKGEPETELGNFVADLCLEEARERVENGVDACLMNFGGLRSSLDSGEVTVGDIYTLMPFDNELVVVTLSAAEVDSMFSYLARVGGQPISDMTLGIEKGRPVARMIGGREVEPGKEYRILTSDYLATGGDKMSFLTEGRRSGYEVVGLKVRDAILIYVRELGENGIVLRAHLDRRIYYLE